MKYIWSRAFCNLSRGLELLGDALRLDFRGLGGLLAELVDGTGSVYQVLLASVERVAI